MNIANHAYDAHNWHLSISLFRTHNMCEQTAYKYECIGKLYSLICSLEIVSSKGYKALLL
jgi:hypothetical protein